MRGEAFTIEPTEKLQVLNLLKTSHGQINGIIRMVEEERYCVDIAKQILAVQALLKKANSKILSEHIKHCVKQAFAEGCGEEKVDEMMELIERYAR
ncbi:MAG: metal-sensing transcriptional repressor [Firmicutes bacterium]|nr:metal-sensing transcriptional repressor [Bacillota bacterium]